MDASDAAAAAAAAAAASQRTLENLFREAGPFAAVGGPIPCINSTGGE